MPVATNISKIKTIKTKQETWSIDDTKHNTQTHTKKA